MRETRQAAFSVAVSSLAACAINCCTRATSGFSEAAGMRPPDSLSISMATRRLAAPVRSKVLT